MEIVRFRRSLAAVAVAALAAPAAASAHATLVRIRPANGVVLATPPAAMRVLFDDAIRPGPGVAAVRNGGGSVLARAAYVPRRNPRELVVPLSHGLANGSYSVRWSVISDDGHNERGVTAFAVGAGAARPTATLTAGGIAMKSVDGIGQDEAGIWTTNCVFALETTVTGSETPFTESVSVTAVTSSKLLPVRVMTVPFVKL